MADDFHRRDSSPAESARDPKLARVLAQVEQALRGLQFGQVTITVQNGVAIQVERLERIRLQRLAD